MRDQRVVIVGFMAAVVVVAAVPCRADWATGVALFDQGRYAEAAEHFREVVRSNPSWPGGYLMLGRCRLALDQTDDAVELLRHAVDLGPGDPNNVVALSQALMARGSFAEAREVLGSLDRESLSPAWRAELSRLTARTLVAEEREAEAVALLEARLAEEPDNPVLHRTLAGIQQAVGDREQALEHLERAFELDPADAASGSAAVDIAMAMAADAGDDAERSELGRRALQIAIVLTEASPGFASSLLAGEAALAARELEAAARHFAQAVAERPDDPLALFYLGRTTAALGRDAEALGRLREALASPPDAELARRIHAQLGRVLACRLELAEAAEHYRAAGELARASRIGELATSYADALERLASQRADLAELEQLKSELDRLGDADGVAALGRRIAATRAEIAGVEANLAEVRNALCQ